MDWLADKDRILEIFKRCRYVLLILLIGIFLMTLPAQEEPENSPETISSEANVPDLQESLSKILSQLSGAGEVAVLLTQSSGEETIYQTDENISADNTQRETVLTSNANREEVGLIKQINPPVYQGAIVLCQGADSASVRLAIVEAVMSVTGLTSDHITVLKMK